MYWLKWDRWRKAQSWALVVALLFSVVLSPVAMALQVPTLDFYSQNDIL